MAAELVPTEKVSKALATIYELNVCKFGDGKMGAVNGMRPDGTLDRAYIQMFPQFEISLTDEQATYLTVDRTEIIIDYDNQRFAFKHNANGHHYQQTVQRKKRIVTIPGLRLKFQGREVGTFDLVLVTSSGSIEFECIKALRNGAGYTPI
ncbi:unnamed protein product, partial [Mesorhabditis belari]|uniref:Glycosyl-hydrolase family 116 catalytic region domain-containing protein n=1 Tax=Mesorhabditis belari TaxID=2138241 RepID=A0AAF3EFB7_9BILA